jgi:hypothetical protein
LIPPFRLIKRSSGSATGLPGLYAFAYRSRRLRCWGSLCVRCSFPARFTLSELVESDRAGWLPRLPRTGNSWDRSRGLVGRLKPAESSRWQSKSMASPLNHQRPNHPHQPGQGIRDRPPAQRQWTQRFLAFNRFDFLAADSAASSKFSNRSLSLSSRTTSGTSAILSVAVPTVCVRPHRHFIFAQTWSTSQGALLSPTAGRIISVIIRFIIISIRRTTHHTLSSLSLCSGFRRPVARSIFG